MSDDFNTPITIAHLFDGVKMINSINDGKETISNHDLEKLKKHYHTFTFDILGLKNEESMFDNNGTVDELMTLIIDIRNQSKEKKDWATADLIRDQLKKLQISIQDNKESSTWKYEK